jgi:hypothetical protein
MEDIKIAQNAELEQSAQNTLDLLNQIFKPYNYPFRVDKSAIAAQNITLDSIMSNSVKGFKNTNLQSQSIQMA